MNDRKRTIRAMTLVALVAYPGVQILDVTGPASVFTTANRVLGRDVYSVRVVSSTGGPVTAIGGITIGTLAARALPARKVHTMLVSGGEESGVRHAIRDVALRKWVTRVAKTAARFGSVCSGAFVIAAYGLAEKKRVTTHWEACERLARTFPSLEVDGDALYVTDGRLWTSAGVTTGIDMSLAMVERDAGAHAASAVAQRLVLHARRPGFQSQFSPLLRAQTKADAAFADLTAYIAAHLDAPLSIDELAARAGQSPRSFHRHFLAAVGEPPARFVETLRLERARTLLQHRLSLKEIASESGFGDPVRLSRAFERRFGIKPSIFRETLASP
jgi:transcriptional regulator GlxA family with amidase domain